MKSYGRRFWCWLILIVPSTFLLFNKGIIHVEEPSNAVKSSLDEIRDRMVGPLEADDPALIEIIRRDYLFAPSSLPYNFSYAPARRNEYLSGDFIKAVLKQLFADTRNGFFVEAGALDGEYMSHTIELETDLGWNGLLVEPDDNNFAALSRKHRRAWRAHCCLALRPYPERVVMRRVAHQTMHSSKLVLGTMSIIKGTDLELSEDHLHNSVLVTGQCLPARSLFAALNVTHVDFFVLDVEKREPDILAHFPFEHVSVDVWAIEHVRYHEDSRFIEAMIARGYYYFDALCVPVADYVFVRKASALFARLRVPPGEQNRTRVCPYKEFNARYLNDPHHFPGLEFSYEPLKHHIPAGQDMPLDVKKWFK